MAGAAAGLVQAQDQPAAIPPVPPPSAPSVPQADPPINPLDLTGRGFAGVRIPLEAMPGRVAFAARWSASWTEPGVTRADGSVSPPTTRLLLRGDVRVTLGVYEFQAASAAAWLAPLDAADPDAAPGVMQVFVYFDRVGTPTEDAAMSIGGDRLPVDGVFTLDAPVELRTDLRAEGRPSGDRFLLEAERAFALHLRHVLTGEPSAESRPFPTAAPAGPVQPADRPYAASTEANAAEVIRQAERGLPPASRDDPIFAKEGVFTVSAGSPAQPGRIELVREPDENAVILHGPVVVQYHDLKRDRTLEMTAERAVIFTDPGAWTDTGVLSAEHVRGVFLEEDVLATDGKYTLRSPRVYYSVRENRAIMLDAVFWTYDANLRMPLYLRADAIRREATSVFTARHARLSNTAFFSPHLSLGASDITLYRAPAEGNEERMLAEARNMTLRAGGVPFFYWPILRGDPAAIPLRDFRVESAGGSGPAIKTNWNAWSLLGVPTTPGNSFELLVDEYFKRGPALGAEMAWQGPTHKGGLFGYAVLNDTGRDLLVTGHRRDRSGEFRGLITVEHRVELADNWAVTAEGASISDPTFLDAFFEGLAKERREFTNSLTARRLEDNTYLGVGARGSLMDFVPNEYLVQSQGYSVDRAPDARYIRLADDVLPEVSPGLLTWSSELRASRLSLNFAETTPRELGFDNPVLSRQVFGVDPDVPIANRLRAAGLTEGQVNRLDTRQELSLHLAAGPVNITPFATGRFTLYDDDFREFSPDADKPYRLWGAFGTKLATSLQRVDNSVESRLFDLHRVRHIVEPSATVWTAATTIDGTDLPVYDDAVEPLAEGTAVRLALDQTWQTQRGGPGRWRSVDVFKLSGEVVTASDDVNRTSPIGRYFDYRPELSRLGDFAGLDARWQVSEAVALTGSTIYDFSIEQPARTVVGGLIQHSPEFSTFAELRYLNAHNQTYFNLGGTYLLTPQYSVAASAAYNADRGDFQTLAGEVRRRFPNVWLGVGMAYDTITDESSFSLVLQPVGVERTTRLNSAKSRR